MWFRRKPNRAQRASLGVLGEDLAVRKLRCAGYRILERNFHIGRYEIDIVAREGDTTAFVEVKTRRHDDAVFPEDNIGPAKIEHLRRAARCYISNQNDPNAYYRFDVVSVVVPEQGKPDVTLYRDAFPGA